MYAKQEKDTREMLEVERQQKFIEKDREIEEKLKKVSEQKIKLYKYY